MKERDIVKKIRVYLNSLDGVYCIKIHGSAYQMPGISDILCCHQGRFIAIEVKRPETKNTVSPPQVFFMDNIGKAGGFSLVATSLDDVKQFVSERLN